MTREELEVFVKGTQHYFEKVSNEECEIGAPFVKGEELIILDYTGLIGITGTKKGGVYITALREMLLELTTAILKTDDVDEDALYDMVGEMANTISGNARTTFGADFEISVPLVIKGRPSGFKFQITPPTYVLPLTWKGHKAYVVTGLEDAEG